MLNQRIKLLWLWGVERLYGSDVPISKISAWILNHGYEVRVGMQENVRFGNLNKRPETLDVGRLWYHWPDLNGVFCLLTHCLLLKVVFWRFFVWFFFFVLVFGGFWGGKSSMNLKQAFTRLQSLKPKMLLVSCLDSW